MMPTIAPGGTWKMRSSISRRSPKDLETCLNSITWSPRRSPGGMKISLVSLRFWYSCEFSSSKRARRALLLTGGPWRSCAPTRSSRLQRLLARLLARVFLLEALVLLLQPRRSSCPSTECRGRGRVRGSTRPRCRGSSGRGSPRPRCRGSAARNCSSHSTDLGVEMVGRFVEQQHVGLATAAGGTARRGASRRRTACRIGASQAAGAARRRRLPAAGRWCAPSPAWMMASRRACSAASLSKSASCSA